MDELVQTSPDGGPLALGSVRPGPDELEGDRIGDEDGLHDAGNTAGRWRVGQVVGDRYLLERRLGSGAMGEVFLARDRLLKKHVAVKVLRADLARGRATVRRFLREVALAQSVTHPHVVRIYDTGEADGLPYFTMEFLQGQRLDELIEEGEEGPVQRLSIREIREVSWEVLHAIAAAHEAGVIHRDLKPSNVLLTHRGAIVMDFGVAGIETASEGAKQPPDTSELKSLVRTEAGTIFGSPAYMAPELWEGAAASVQSDLYAFGVMLYQMLTGKLPYDAPTPAAFLEKLRTQSPTPVKALRRDTPWTLALLVKRCMAPHPDERPASAAAAANLISPLRSRRRRRAAAVLLGAAAVLGATAMMRSGASWQQYGLPDAVAEADLGAAVRSYDVGDRTSSLRHLERLYARAPTSAAVTFWRATLHHEMGDEIGRLEACSAAETWDGHEDWRAAAEAACGSSYSLSASVLGALSNEPGNAGDEFLPLAIEESLVPRLEGMAPNRAAREEARHVLQRLEKEPEWSPLWALPTRWQIAKLDLQLASGHLAEAQTLLNDLLASHPSTPIVLEKAAWLELHNGNLDRARELAEVLLPTDPTAHVRLLLESGRLEHAWDVVAGTEGGAYHPILRELWCGYAYRFEVRGVPARCAGMTPGLVRMLWGGSAATARDRSAMSPIEIAILRRQREVDLAECGRSTDSVPLLTHASAPFELYLAELEIAAAVCAAEPELSDLKYARKLAHALVAVAPQDPWALLVQAQVDEALGENHLARAKRLAVAERWRAADPSLPLVTKLRRHVGIDTVPAAAATEATANSQFPAADETTDPSATPG